jgi:enolase
LTDREGHPRILDRDIQIVGDDLLTTSLARLEHGICLGAANTMLLKVNQIGTITEAFDAVQLACRNGYGVMPCASRGVGDATADCSVGLGAGTVILGATGSTGDRFIDIERELGPAARFLGKDDFQGGRDRRAP